MLQRVHIIVGALGLVVFVLQGQYMDQAHDHLAGMPDATRMMYRSSHIYLLLASVLNVVLGIYRVDDTLPMKPLIRGLVSGVALLAPAALLLGFFLEPAMPDLARPFTRPALYAFFGVGVIASIAGFAGWRRR